MGSDDDFPIRQVLSVGARFCFWARWARVFTAKSMYYSKYSTLIAILALPNSQRSWEEWIEPDRCCYLILDNFDVFVLHQSLIFRT